MGSRDNVSLKDVYDYIPTLKDLLELIEEDFSCNPQLAEYNDRLNEEDLESKKLELQTELTLLKLYYEKLPKQM